MTAPSASSSPNASDVTAPLSFTAQLRAAATVQRIDSENNSAFANSNATATVAAATGTGAFAGGSAAATQMLGDMDLSTVSPLCHQLLATKKRMMSELSNAADDVNGDGDARSDDDEPTATTTNSSTTTTKSLTAYKQSKLKTENSSNNKALHAAGTTDDLSPKAILERKAQRRREQVRAASRRCRDRQRRETEDLRKKVFQLEEFIAHTITSYEQELRTQRQQFERLAHAHEQLQRRSRDVLTTSPNGSRAVLALPVSRDCNRATSSSVSPAGVDTSVFGIKAEEIAPFAHRPQPPTPPVTNTAHLTVLDQWRAYDDLEYLYHRVAETKAILSKILVPPAHPEIAQRAFGWDFQFWLEGSRYYAKSSKFFPNVRGFDVAQRMHRIEPSKYIETFPEVYAKKVLKVFHDDLKIVETVKALPGKQPLGSVTVQFVSHDDAYSGNRCFFANRSVALPQSMDFGHHKECNGYAFEDMTQTRSDGTVVDGCLVQGVGGYDSMGKQPEVLMAELAKIFSSVVLRWESLFVNDYIPEDVEASLADIELDFAS